MDHREELRSIVGRAHCFAGDEIDQRYRTDLLGLYTCSPSCVVRPGSAGEVARVMEAARKARIAVTVLGGGTGGVGGTACTDGGIILSLERMNRVLEIDEDAMTITAEAGVTLQSLQEAAAGKGLLMPLDIGSRGSATIGGNIATNAGGLRTLRWGMMRDMVLGLEAVLADGTVVSRLGKVLKDNAGYDWKHLFIGSEGTLAIVTQAVLRLRPLPTTAQTALLAFDTVEQASRLLRRLQRDLDGRLSSFELMWRDFFNVIGQAQSARRPLPMSPEYRLYAIVEALGSHPERDRQVFEEVLSAIFDGGVVHDGVIAQSERERQNIWALREDLLEPLAALSPFAGFDISLSLLDMDRFIEQTDAKMGEMLPGAVVLHYGHGGDGNMHLIVSHPALHDPQVMHATECLVYDAIRQYRGSIAAEHGIGQAKLEFLDRSRSREEIALMRSLKQALDPLNLLNPGKVFPAAG
ncbi:FAD-binding oxidoreductase [Sphingobium fuliginis]|nr:FAD-binding oxidoreductase [Sphingobium fuliginis]